MTTIDSRTGQAVEQLDEFRPTASRLPAVLEEVGVSATRIDWKTAGIIGFALGFLYAAVTHARLRI